MRHSHFSCLRRSGGGILAVRVLGLGLSAALAAACAHARIQRPPEQMLVAVTGESIRFRRLRQA